MKIPVCLLRTEWPPTLYPGDLKFDSLLLDVQKNGILEPLTINFNWIVLDGNHRLAVARFLGIDRVEVKVWTGMEFII